MADLEVHTKAVLDLVDRIRPSDQRLVIGVAGPPGSGKSTLAARVVERLNAGEEGTSLAALMPMDGFHLENDVLDERGLRAVKGAPQTFDAAGFVELVKSLKTAQGDIRYPHFSREQDRTLPGAGCLTAGTPIVVVEGNYLLLRYAPWSELKPLFDATVLISPPIEVLEERLIERWLNHGLSQVDAENRARGNDLTNARHVIENSAEADLLLTSEIDPDTVP
ncbi:MAG: uridine kinase [Rhodobacteraceae bacterium]|nr:uridine kinase [Paracoccaceae bacterium]